jgi:hypothetical protein
MTNILFGQSKVIHLPPLYSLHLNLNAIKDFHFTIFDELRQTLKIKPRICQNSSDSLISLNLYSDWFLISPGVALIPTKEIFLPFCQSFYSHTYLIPISYSAHALVFSAWSAKMADYDVLFKSKKCRFQAVFDD